MLIVCPSCASEYTIDPEKLGADGRTVRCAICRDTWFVSLDDSPSPNVNDPDVSNRLTPHAGDTPVPILQPPARFSKGRSALVLLTALALGAAGWATATQNPALTDFLQERIAQGRQILPWASSGKEQLEFRNVRADLTAQDGTTTLLVAGEIVNETRTGFDIPHLEFLVRSEDEKVLETWTEAPPQPTLGPGEAVRFTIRYPSPPPDGRQVRVQFTTVGGIAVAVHSPSI